jgi:hypothetical protein
VAATGSITFAANPSDGDTITLNGITFTFVDAAPAGNEILIGATLADTLDNAVTALNASADPDVAAATYGDNGTDRLLVTHATAGPDGNSFTLAASAATVSGPTLTGVGHAHVWTSGGSELPSLALEAGHPKVPAFFLTTAVLGGSLALGVALATPAALAFSRDPALVFVNELHYDNCGGDRNEAVEVAGPAETDLSGWRLVLYNGSDGADYFTHELSGLVPDQGDGFGTVLIGLPTANLQNGSPDGLALVDADGRVVQFLSYEGRFRTASSPAAGMDSTDIGVAEPGGTPEGHSLQLAGEGRVYRDSA